MIFAKNQSNSRDCHMDINMTTDALLMRLGFNYVQYLCMHRAHGGGRIKPP